MIVPAGRFSAMLTPRLHAIATLRSIDQAIGTMRWYNVPAYHRAWLRLRGRKSATITRLAMEWNAMMPPPFRED